LQDDEYILLDPVSFKLTAPAKLWAVK